MLDFSKFPESKVYVAIHESGHAVCALLLGCAVERISIRSDKEDDGTCDHTDPQKPTTADTILLGGLAACMLYDEFRGMVPKSELHEEQARADMLLTKGPVEDAYKKARKLLEENWDGLERIAMAALKSRFGIIVASEIDRAFG